MEHIQSDTKPLFHSANVFAAYLPHVAGRTHGQKDCSSTECGRKRSFGILNMEAFLRKRTMNFAYYTYILMS